MRFAPGTILIFDRGYTDYQWFTSLTQQGVYFVTRLKENADYGVVEATTAGCGAQGANGVCHDSARDE
jgi:hypothetical protein